MSKTASIFLLTVIAAGIARTSVQAQCWTSQQNTNFLGGTRTGDTTLDACQYSCQINPTCNGVDWNPSSSDMCWLTFPSLTQNNVDGITHYSLSTAASCRLSASSVSTPRPTHLPTTPAFNPQLIDVAFLIDSSSNIGSNTNWQQLKSFIKNIVDGFTVGPSNVLVAAVTFSNFANVHFYLNSHWTATGVKTAIDGLSFENGAGVALSSALDIVRSSVMTPTNGARMSASRVAVLFTDGRDNNDPQALVEAASLRNASIRLLAVGLTNNVNTARLLSILASPFDFYNASGFFGLDWTLASRLSDAISYAGSACLGSRCLENPCARDGLSCCGCECVDFASYQVCQCCPRDYKCCSYSSSVAGVSQPVCCPVNSDCNRQTDGSYRCSANDIQRDPSLLVCEDCDPMYLSVTADRSISALYMDGASYSLPNAGTWNAVDTIPMPADTNVIAAYCTASSSTTRAGLLASITNDYLLTGTTWKCSTSSQTGWTGKSFDDSSWPNAAISASGNSGLRPISTRSNWIWSSRSSSPNVDTQVYCRGYLPKNSCDVNYGNCSNLCAKRGMVCCYCEMARAGPTKVCSCCPAGYHCCPYTPRDGDCTGDAGCQFSQPVCCPDGYQCTSYGTCSTQGQPRSTEQRCSDCTPQCPTPTPPTRNCIVDLAIIIDASDSIKPTNWVLVGLFAAALAGSSQLNVGPGQSRVACIVFSATAEIRFGLSDNRDVLNQLQNLTREPQGTNLNDALSKLFDNRVFGQTNRRVGVLQVAVIITDGVDNVHEDQTLTTAYTCKKAGYYLVSVGVTSEIDKPKLMQISSLNVYNEVTNFVDLNVQLAERIVSQSCSLGAPRKACVGSWIASENTNTLGSIFVNAYNLSDCQSACMDSDNCTGIDWNPTDADNYTCWVSGPWNTGRRNGTADGITHYDLVTKTCNGSATPTTRSPSTSPSPCVWNVIPDTHYFNGITIASANTEYGCKTSCEQYTGCTGIDWNIVAADGVKCFLTGAWSPTFVGDSPGINHWQLTRNSGCGN